MCIDKDRIHKITRNYKIRHSVKRPMKKRALYLKKTHQNVKCRYKRKITDFDRHSQLEIECQISNSIE